MSPMQLEGLSQVLQKRSHASMAAAASWQSCCHHMPVGRDGLLLHQELKTQAGVLPVSGDRGAEGSQQGRAESREGQE